MTEKQKINEINKDDIRFHFTSENGKLLLIDLIWLQKNIQKQNQIHYLGEIQSHPLIDFQLIKQSLTQGEYKPISSDQSAIKLKIGPILLEFHANTQSETQRLQKLLNMSLQAQHQLQTTVRNQAQEINHLKYQLSLIKQQMSIIKQSLLSQNKQKQTQSQILLMSNQMQLLKQEILQLRTMIKQMDQKVRIKSIQIRDSKNKGQQQLKNQKNLKKQQTKIVEKQKDLSRLWLAPDLTFWSNSYKSSCLKVDYQSKFVKYMFDLSHNYQFCLMDRSFTSQLQGKVCWGVRMKTKIDSVVVGLALFSSIRANQYSSKNFRSFSNGHGLFAICSSGGTYHNTSKQINGNPDRKAFAFKENDRVYMEYDPLNSKLRIRHNDVGHSYEMPIDRLPQGDCYYPFVALRAMFDEVELILPGCALS